MANATAAVRFTAVSYLNARIASVLSILPLGVWTVGHVWHNLAAFEGPDAWQKAVTTYPHPAAQFLTLVVVLLPLAIHAVWGAIRVTTSRPNNQRYNTFDNLKYILQRASAVGVLLFVGAHIWLAALHPRLVEGHAETFGALAHEMHFHIPTLVVYLLGTLGVSYHLANGLHSFAMGWGIATSRRALKNLDAWVIGAFVVMLAMSWGAIYALYAAAH
jgi:succinate dehydrogenase / fumarate reductase cytochrome b subunit